METSLLWALDPACVDVSRLPSVDDVGPHFAMGPNAREANRRTGERMVADEVAWLGDKGRELLAAYERDRPTRRLSTFEDVEVLWETVVRPRFGEFRTMQSDWSVAPVPEGSVWRTNAAIPDRS